YRPPFRKICAHEVNALEYLTDNRQGAGTRSDKPDFVFMRPVAMLNRYSAACIQQLKAKLEEFGLCFLKDSIHRPVRMQIRFLADQSVKDFGTIVYTYCR